MNYLLGLDLGTTGSKTLIADVNGRTIAQGYREYACTYPKPAWVEQDVDLVVAKSMEATKEVIEKTQIDPGDILAISLSSQRCCTIPVDSQGKLVRPMISWQDNRTLEEVELIRKEISDREFYEITGLPFNTTWMISKILWLKRHEPETMKRTAKIVQLHDYVLKAWGADDYYDDYSDASFYGLWDARTMSWHENLCQLIGLSQDQLPQVGPSGRVIGKLGKQAAECTGLREGTPLCIGAGDQNSAAVGAGVVVPGTVNSSLGTGGAAITYADAPFRDPNGKTMVTHHPIPGKWMIEGYQAGAASVYRWFRDEITSLEKSFASCSKKDIYQILDEMVDQVPAGSKGLVLLPYFAGSAAPRWNPEARGTLLGLTFAHDRNCLVRAFMEGITLEVRDMLQSIRESGFAISEVRVLGGPTKSKIWNQIQSDVYNCPVRTLKNTDAAVVGALIFAGLGAGVFSSIPEGCEKVVQIDETFTPNSGNVPIYDAAYDVFAKAYTALTDGGIFNAITKMQQ